MVDIKILNNLLSAVLKMLEDCKPEKVECARDVINELINYLDAGEVTANSIKIAPIFPIAEDIGLDQEAQQAKKELLE